MQEIHKDVAIIIPSRIGAIRLPQKPLAKIGNLSMIEHIIKKVKETNIANIYVATDSDLIAETVKLAGAKYIMTSPLHVTGTERVYEAFSKITNKDIEYVINVQGDMPFVDSNTILQVIDTLKSTNFDIITPVVKAKRDVADNPSHVKVVTDKDDKALYFSRNLIPSNAEEFLLHVGIYGFKKNILEKFVKLPISELEIAEKNLEQLRALANNISIGVCYVNSYPISVDTVEDLKKAQDYYQALMVNFN